MMAAESDEDRLVLAEKSAGNLAMAAMEKENPMEAMPYVD